MTKKDTARVTIFGRANTGKSTLFNTLTEGDRALVAPDEGVTRDYNAAETRWRGMDIEVIDTGGIMETPEELSQNTSADKKESINAKVRRQALNYLDKSEVILLVTDVKTGILPQDQEIARWLKKKFPEASDKHIILVANKADKGRKDAAEAAVFHQLGLGNPLPVSAATGSGTGDLLDEIMEVLKDRGEPDEEQEEKEDEFRPTSVCIIGKPNVGKSSLLNSLLKEEKAIVSDIPHTTREPRDMEVTYNNTTVVFTDTAGINRGIKKTKGLERWGVERSLSSLKRSDISLLVLDITQEITQQEKKLIDEILEKRKSLIIIANKWDLVEDKNTSAFTEYIYKKLPFVTWAPVKFVSASSGKNVEKIYDLISEVREQRRTELSKSQLDRFVNRVVKKHSPTKAKGYKRPYIYEVLQSKTDPPKFDIRIGKRDTLNESYVRFIENQLRQQFGFTGTPINIEVVR